jgi:DnaK suppressor protein
MDQEMLSRFRRVLKQQRDAVHLRLVFAREQSSGLDRFEIKDERGSFSTACEMTAFGQTQAQEQLTEINAALDRIDAGMFGLCLSCGLEISLKRLEAIPWAQYCITCQELMNAA